MQQVLTPAVRDSEHAAAVPALHKRGLRLDAQQFTAAALTVRREDASVPDHHPSRGALRSYES
ncbi:MAG: hypothetical protein M3Q82_05055 [Actinomycetota bacterium]|nr:hypothetical protein [Actinomycetota bacterium]